MKKKGQLAALGTAFAVVVGTTVVATVAVITAIGAVAYIVCDKYKKFTSGEFKFGSLKKNDDDFDDDFYDEDDLDFLPDYVEDQETQHQKIIRRKVGSK